MPIQNNAEIRELAETSRKLENATREAINSANPEEIQQLLDELNDVQEHIQEARGKAINGHGSSTEPLIDAQLRVEVSQRLLDRAYTNINATQDSVQP